MKRLEQLKPLINLKNKNDFFIVRILKRRKDNPDLEYSEKQLKVYSFYSWEDFHKQEARIKELCDLNNARAYLRLNTQNALDISLRMQKEIIDNILNDCPHKNEGVWNSITGKGGSKNWVLLDLDEEHLHLLKDIKQDLNVEFNKREDKLVEEVIADIHSFRDKNGMFGELTREKVKDSYSNMFPLIENPTKSGVHLITRPFDTRILEKYNKELSSKGIPTIVIKKDSNTILYIGNEE